MPYPEARIDPRYTERLTMRRRTLDPPLGGAAITAAAVFGLGMFPTPSAPKGLEHHGLQLSPERSDALRHTTRVGLGELATPRLVVALPRRNLSIENIALAA